MNKYGKLEPVGGGDTIPLLNEKLLVGRRESCDIVLRFKNVSAHHCQLYINEGYWFARDLNSRNGTRVHNERINIKRLDPGCVIQFAKHQYIVEYDPADLGASGPPPSDDDGLRTILGQSLLGRIVRFPGKSAGTWNKKRTGTFKSHTPNFRYGSARRN